MYDRLSFGFECSLRSRSRRGCRRDSRIWRRRSGCSRWRGISRRWSRCGIGLFKAIIAFSASDCVIIGSLLASTSPWLIKSVAFPRRRVAPTTLGNDCEEFTTFALIFPFALAVTGIDEPPPNGVTRKSKRAVNIPLSVAFSESP